MSSADTELCVSETNRPDERTRPASHERDELRESTIYFLHSNRDGGIFSRGPAVRDPVTGFRIAHQFVRGPISLRLRFTAQNVFARGDLGGAIHEVNRN